MVDTDQRSASGLVDGVQRKLWSAVNIMSVPTKNPWLTTCQQSRQDVVRGALLVVIGRKERLDG